jgi:hypothetical protein
MCTDYDHLVCISCSYVYTMRVARAIHIEWGVEAVLGPPFRCLNGLHKIMRPACTGTAPFHDMLDHCKEVVCLGWPCFQLLRMCLCLFIFVAMWLHRTAARFWIIQSQGEASPLKLLLYPYSVIRVFLEEVLALSQSAFARVQLALQVRWMFRILCAR